MSFALDADPPSTLDAFLAWEDGQEVRHEWDGVQPIALTGSTLAASRIGSMMLCARISATPPAPPSGGACG